MGEAKSQGNTATQEEETKQKSKPCSGDQGTHDGSNRSRHAHQGFFVISQFSTTYFVSPLALLGSVNSFMVCLFTSLAPGKECQICPNCLLGGPLLMADFRLFFLFLWEHSIDEILETSDPNAVRSWESNY